MCPTVTFQIWISIDWPSVHRYLCLGIHIMIIYLQNYSYLKYLVPPLIDVQEPIKFLIIGQSLPGDCSGNVAETGCLIL